MKLARLSSLMFIPMAFSAVVVPNEMNEFSEVNDMAAAVELSSSDATPWITKERFAEFIEDARVQTNKAIYDESIRLGMEDGPTNLSELLDMIFSTEAINKAQMHAAANENPIQDLINGVGGFINGISSGLGNGINGLLNPNITTVRGPNVTIVGQPGAQPSGQPGFSFDDFFQGLAGATNDTGKILSDLTGGIVNGDILNNGLNVVGGTIDDFLSGKVTLGDAVGRVNDFFTKFFGSENPLGKFIQNLASYLSTNQDGIFANFIKFGTFLNAAVVTIGAILFNSISNIVGGVTKGVYNIFSGVVNNILGGVFKSAQTEGLGSFASYQAMFLDVVPTQPIIDPTSFAQQILNIIGAAVKKVMAADPMILSVLINPSAENIKKAVDTILKVLTAKN